MVILVQAQVDSSQVKSYRSTMHTTVLCVYWIILKLIPFADVLKLGADNSVTIYSTQQIQNLNFCTVISYSLLIQKNFGVLIWLNTSHIFLYSVQRETIVLKYIFCFSYFTSPNQLQRLVCGK